MSNDNQKYLSSSQQRVLNTLKALFGHEITGVTSKELAQRLGTSASQVFKDLMNLQEAGIAEQLPNKNWRISAGLGREAIKILNHINEGRQRVEEVSNRYTRTN